MYWCRTVLYNLVYELLHDSGSSRGSETKDGWGAFDFEKRPVENLAIKNLEAASGRQVPETCPDRFLQNDLGFLKMGFRNCSCNRAPFGRTQKVG